ncbi:cytochrome P450 [Mycena floridula]|nr:cytochrome P450 [Mycena floridula]
MATDLILYVLLALFPLLALSKPILTYFDNQRRLRNIPIVGPSGFFSSYIGGFRYLTDAPRIVHEGYKKYPGRPFRVALLHKWQIVISGADKVEDLRRAAPEYFSTYEEIDEFVQGEHTLGWYPNEDLYHVLVVRGELTRKICTPRSSTLGQSTYLQLEVSSYSQSRRLQRIVARATSKIFVGLPLCRDPKYVDNVLQLAIDVMTSGMLISMFPEFLKPFVRIALGEPHLIINSIFARFITRGQAKLAEAEKFLEPIIRGRMGDDAKFGRDRPGRPDDLISWLINGAPASEQTVHGIALRVLVINMASIHTTSMALTAAVYRLVEHPGLIPILREEIESAVKTEGFTKAAVNKMHKVDAFFMESQKMAVLNAVGMKRKIMKDFTFSDGTVVPAGFSIGVAQWSLHYDGSIYPDPSKFNPFRSPATEEEVRSAKFRQSMVTPRLDYIPFGHGGPACPGRFLASSELKLLLAQMSINYDIKAVDDNFTYPFQSGSVVRPSPTSRSTFFSVQGPSLDSSIISLDLICTHVLSDVVFELLVIFYLKNNLCQNVIVISIFFMDNRRFDDIPVSLLRQIPEI